MSTPYTPTPAPLPASLDLPQDGVDSLVVETVNTNTAAIADAVALAEENIDALEGAVGSGFGRFLVGVTTYSVNDWLTFTVEEATSSPTRTPVGKGSHSGAGNGDYISLGTGGDCRGWWRVSIEAMATTPGDSVIESMPIRLVRHDSSTDPTVGATTLRDWVAYRYSDNDSFYTVIKGEYLFEVTSPTTNVRLSLKNITTIKTFGTVMTPLVTVEQLSKRL